MTNYRTADQMLHVAMLLTNAAPHVDDETGHISDSHYDFKRYDRD